MSDPLPIEQLPQALNALCFGELGESDAARLASLLRRDVHARRFYIQYMDLHAALMWQANERPSPLSIPEADTEEWLSTEQLLAEVLEQERAAEAARLAQEAKANREQAVPAGWAYRPAEQVKPAVRQIVIPKWLVYGGIAAVLALVGVLIVRMLPDKPVTTPGLNPGVAQAEPDPVPAIQPVPVATIISTDNAVWVDTHAVLGDGHRVYSGPLTLESGRAVLRFSNETLVELEGPCVLEPISGSAMRLSRGRLVGRCETPMSKGFVVHTPNAQVIDLGTEFGVLVEEDQTAKVFVYEGEVQLMTQQASATLRGGQAARIDNQATLSLMPEDALAFLPETDLAGEALDIRSYYASSVLSLKPVAYYRFEQEGGGAVANAVGGQYTAQAQGELTTRGTERNRIGVFNGNYLHVQTPMPELTAGDYTIEFWVRPERDGVMPIVGFYCGGTRWGGVIETGEHFRFLHRSPAGEQFETGNSVLSAIAPTAGRWQHVVAVRDGRDLMIYIDGKLAGSALAPNPLTPAPQLIIAGGDTATSPYSQKQAFVGQLDEIAIYDRALTRVEIAHHYRLVAGRDAEGGRP